jgi:hypothetical protein
MGRNLLLICISLMLVVSPIFAELTYSYGIIEPVQRQFNSKALRINASNAPVLTGTEQTSIEIQKRTLLAGALFIPTMLMGFGLTAQEKPHNILLVTGHKLCAAADLALLNYTVYQKNKIKPLGAAEITAAILTNVCFVATIATGAMETFEKPMPDIVHKIHQSGPWLSMASSFALMYLLERNL